MRAYVLETRAPVYGCVYAQKCAGCASLEPWRHEDTESKSEEGRTRDDILAAHSLAVSHLMLVRELASYSRFRPWVAAGPAPPVQVNTNGVIVSDHVVLVVS